MADIELRVGGDASGATAALSDVSDATRSNAEEVGKASAKWAILANVMLEAAKSAVKFGVDAVREWAKAEQVSKQLERAAGSQAKALEAQADAMERLLGVDGDAIKQSQTLLAQWGGVGAATADVTKAILDYAEATGQDAVGATSSLIQQVESGGAGLRKLGLDFTATGNKGKDLGAAVEAITKKFGGAADANAETFNAALGRADGAFGNLKEAIGGAAAQLLTDMGTFETATRVMQGLADAIEGKNTDPEALKASIGRENQRAKMVQDVREIEERVKATQQMMVGASGPLMEALSGTLKATQAELDTAQQKLNDFMNGIAKAALAAPAVTGGPVTGLTAGGAAAARAAAAEMDKLREDNAAAYREYLKQEEEADDNAVAAKQRTHEELLKSERRLLEGLEATRQKEMDDEAAFYAKQGETVAAQLKKNADEEVKIREDAAKRVAEIEKHAADQARQAADQIGAAFVGALTEQLGKLAQGEEFDPSVLVESILIATISAAATVIGAAYGMPALGAAVGNLAGLGISAGFAAGRPKKPRKYHDGGWVEPDAPRYHGGFMPGETPAILQEGEAVLSRANVASMGGPSGVEAVKRGGGGGLTVNITAMDTQSVKESFMDRGARGLREALRTGIGPLPQLLPQGSR